MEDKTTHMPTDRLSRYTLSILLTLFVASLIVFDLSQNVIYNNIMNVIVLAVFFFFFLIRKDYTFPFNAMILSYIIFTIFSVMSLFWAMDFDLAFGFAMRLIVASINLVVLYAIFRRYNIENTILYGILLGAFFNYLIAFDLVSVNYSISLFGRFTGTEGNPNKLSKIMLISIFASLVLLTQPNLKSYFRVYNYFNIILSSYMIFLTISKKAIILAPLLIFSTVSFKRISIKNILLFIGILVVSYQVYSRYMDVDYVTHYAELLMERFNGLIDALSSHSGDASSNERKELLLEGLEAFYDHPVLGIGLNNFRLIFVKYAHNNYLELLVGVGIVGTMLYYTMYYIVLRQVNHMYASPLKRYMYVMIFILLLLDFATVTYYDKPVLFTLLYIYYVATINEKSKVKTAPK